MPRPTSAQNRSIVGKDKPYSPELNRIEPVFKQVKHHDMPVRSYTSKADLRQAVEEGFESYRRRSREKRHKQPRLAA